MVRFTLLLSLLIAAAPLFAREIPTTSPAREGFSAERLERLTEHMQGRVDDGTMVGGMGLIARNGRVIYQQTWGQADREADRAMTEDAIFRIYSMSKPITGVALMMLYEEGKFFLNDPIAMYIPELANLQVALSTADGGTEAVSDGTTSRTIGEGDTSQAGNTRAPTRQPTVRDLMMHTAGFTYGFFGNTEVDKAYREAGILNNTVDLKGFVTDLGKLPLQYDPGTRWHYSVSVDIQGRLVEVLSGMKFSEFLQKRLFEPLDMRDTSFVVPADKLDRFTQMYSPAGIGDAGPGSIFMQPGGKGLEVAHPSLSDEYINGAAMESGGGGLVSTSRDYLRFTQMLLNGGELDGARILSPKTVALMSTNHLGDIPMGFGRRGVGFGLDFAVVLNPGDAGEVGSTGEYNWGGAAGTTFWIDPEEQMIGIFMVQSLPHRTRLRSEFKVLTYQAMTESLAD